MGFGPPSPCRRVQGSGFRVQKKMMKESKDGKLSAISVAFELMTMRNAVQLNWKSSMQAMSNLFQAAFWLMVVTKSTFRGQPGEARSDSSC